MRLIQAVAIVLPFFAGVRAVVTFDHAPTPNFKDLASSAVPVLEVINAIESASAAAVSSNDFVASGVLDDLAGSGSNWNDDPVKAWEESGVIWPKSFWEPTLVNAMETNSTGLFHDFLENYNTDDHFMCTDSDSAIHKSPMECFAEHFAGVLELDCNIHTPYKCQRPDRKTIMTFISARWPQKSTADRIALTRHVYFALNNFDAMLGDLHTNYRIVDSLHGHLQAHAQTLVKTFTPQPDKAKIISCEIFKSVAQTAMQTYLSAVFPVVHAVFENVGKGKKIEKNVAAAAHRQYESAKFNWKKVDTNSRLGHAYRVLGIQTRNMFAKYPGLKAAMVEDGASEDIGEERLQLEKSTAKGICGVWFGVAPDDTEGNVERAQLYISDQIKRSMEDFSMVFDLLVKGRGDIVDEEHSVLKAAMSLDRLIETQEISAPTVNQISRTTEQSMNNLMISQLLAQSRCFMECNERADAQEICKTNAHNERYYCPPENEKVACKASCFQKKQDYNHKIDVFGRKSLPAFGSDMRQLAENSWKHYTTTGARAFDPLSTVIEHGGIATPNSLLHLPLCYSKVESLGNFKQVPLSCGQHFTSNETQGFMRDTAIAPTEEDEVAKWRVPETLRQIKSPVKSFFLLCNLNLMWSHSKNHAYMRRTHGADPRCPTLLAETKYMDEFLANYYFCEMSTDAKNVFKEEINHLLIHVGLKNSKEKCKAWGKSKKTKKMVKDLGGSEGVEVHVNAMLQNHYDDLAHEEMQREFLEEEQNVGVERRRRIL